MTEEGRREGTEESTNKLDCDNSDHGVQEKGMPGVLQKSTRYAKQDLYWEMTELLTV